MKESRKVIKGRILLSESVEEADKVIVEKGEFESIGEKVAFLKGMFDIESVGHKENIHDEATYWSLLSAIISLSDELW